MKEKSNTTLTLFIPLKEGEEEVNITQEDLAQIIRLKKMGVPARTIASSMQQKYGEHIIQFILDTGCPPPHKDSFLDAYLDEIIAGLYRHNNASALYRELGGSEVLGGVRNFQKYVKPIRALLKSKATYAQTCIRRIETAPGEQMQIDFGQRRVKIDGRWEVAHFFVAVLSYSRMVYVARMPDQSQESWLKGLAGAFQTFGGVPRTVLSDNARALVKQVQGPNRPTQLTDGYRLFATTWGFLANLAPPYCPTAKGKVERRVRFLDEDGLCKQHYECWEEFDQRLKFWVNEVINKREISSLQDKVRVPVERFATEKQVLHSIPNSVQAYDAIAERRLDDKGILTFERKRYYIGHAYRRDRVMVKKAGSVIWVYRNIELLKKCDLEQDALRVVITPVELDGKAIVGSFDPRQQREFYKAFPDRVSPLERAALGRRENVGEGREMSTTVGTGHSERRATFAPNMAAYKRLGGRHV